MTKKLITFSLFSILILSGCVGQKTPGPGSNVTDANEIAGDTISIDESAYGAGNSGGYNSSTDGMKSVYFEFGDYDLSSGMQGTVTFNANVLRKKLQSGKVKLEGNCDEFGTDEYNYALGLKRAKAVRDSLVSQGIGSGQVLIVSFGESNPQCREATDGCYSRNRRVDLHLVR
ncbi:MAG: OmpA family protein [Campylobacterota bacterium]|nr:OmpA family protein [Campylobacterota bacterium]